MQQDQQAMQDMKVLLCYSCDGFFKILEISNKIPMFGPSKDFTHHGQSWPDSRPWRRDALGNALGPWRRTAARCDSREGSLEDRIKHHAFKASLINAVAIYLEETYQKRQKCQDKIKTLSANHMFLVICVVLTIQFSASSFDAQPHPPELDERKIYGWTPSI